MVAQCFLMPAVDCVTWPDNLRLPCHLFLTILSEVKSRIEENHYLQTNQQQTTHPVIFTTYELKPVIFDSLQNIL